MPRSNPLQSAFNAGEISERLHARLDFSKYPNALETCVNLIPLGEGGLMRRPGTRFMAELKSSAVKGRMKRFEFSTTQAYQIEMGEQMFRFFKDQGQITVQDTDAAITNGQFTSGIGSWTDRSTGGAGNQISHDATNKRLTLETSGTAVDDIGWAEQVVTNTTSGEHVLQFQVIGAPSDRIELRIGTATLGEQILADTDFEVGYHCFAFTATAADFYIQFRNRGDFRDKDVQIDNVSLIDNSPVELQTPYLEAQLFQVNGPQSADLIYLFHPSHPVYKLTRLGHTSWSLIEAAFEDGPWGKNNSGITATTMNPASATGLGVTVTASAIIGINDNAGFKSTDVGRLIRISDNSTENWGWGVIVAFTDTLNVKVDIRRNWVITTAEVDWRLGEWSATTGYPSNGTFYQQRLFGADTSDQPQTWWASNTGNFLVHSPDSPDASAVWNGTVEDDDSLDYTIAADNANEIRWMLPGENTITFGTQGGEWTGASTGAVITPTDVVVNPATSHGVANTPPLRVDNVALFIQRAKRKVREFGFNFENDGFKAFDMTRLAEHISRGGLVEMAFAEEPDSLVWVVRNDGQLLSMTFRREEDVVGWARHIIGGSFGSGNSVVESVSVIPGANNDGQTQSSESRDEVWMIVKRTINGDTKRYVEMMEVTWDDSFDQEDAYYSDSLITYDSTSDTALTGYGHLIGETLKVFADGAVQPDKVVAAGGALTIETAAKVVQAGLGYTHTAKSLKLITGTAAGSPVGSIKQIFGVTFIVMDSHTIGFGPTTTELREIDFREVSDAMDTGVPFFTGEHFEPWDDDWTTDPRIVVQSDSPTPFTLLGMVPKTDTKELF